MGGIPQGGRRPAYPHRRFPMGTGPNGLLRVVDARLLLARCQRDPERRVSGVPERDRRTAGKDVSAHSTPTKTGSLAMPWSAQKLGAIWIKQTARISPRRHTSPVHKVGTDDAVKCYLSPVGGQLPQDLVEIASTRTRRRRLLNRVLEVRRGQPRPETRALAPRHALVAEQAARVGAVGAFPFDHGAGGDGDGLAGLTPPSISSNGILKLSVPTQSYFVAVVELHTSSAYPRTCLGDAGEIARDVQVGLEHAPGPRRLIGDGQDLGVVADLDVADVDASRR